MKMEIINDKKEWDKWQIQQNQAEFLQSWEWGEFQENTGKKVWRWRILDEVGQVVGQVQGFEHQLGLGMKYLYVPRLCLPAGEAGTIDYGLQTVVEYCKKNNYIFLRLEPTMSVNLQSVHAIEGSRLRSGTICNLQLTKNRQPQTTLVLDLTKSEEEILSAMHAKTRYNIHLAEKHEVEVRLDKDVEIFWRLNLETISRDQFKSHDKGYYQKMLQMDIVHQLTAYYKNKPIASDIFIGFGDTFVYLHGTSSSDFRNLMASYLLQWEGIKLGKKLGCKFCDFWGIAPLVNENDLKPHGCFNSFCWEVNHPWTGVTRFKVGFGGKVREYPQACDIILKLWYYRLYKLGRKVRGLK